MHSFTPAVVPASRPKPGWQAYLGWFLAAFAVPLTSYFLVSVAAAVDREWGVVGVVVGLALFPVTLLMMPFYAALASGEWLLVGLLAWLVAVGWLFHMLPGHEARSAG